MADPILNNINSFLNTNLGVPKPIPTPTGMNSSNASMAPTSINGTGAVGPLNVPVNKTPAAHNVANANPITLPTTNSNGTTSTERALQTSVSNHFATPPPPPAMYDTTNGFLTPAGKAAGMKPVQPGDPAGGSDNTSLINNYLGGSTVNSNPSNINNGNLIPDTSNNQNNALLTQYQGLNQQLAGQQSVRTDLNNQNAVDQKQQDYINNFNAYNKAQIDSQQQIERIRTDPNLTKEQSQAQINEISKENNANIANLAVASAASQGLYTTALDIVQRKMDAQFKPVQEQIDNLKAITQSPNANLTASQNAQINANMFALQNNLTNTKNALSTGSQTLIQNGLYTADIGKQLDAAQTPEQVNSIISNAMTGAGLSYNPNGSSGTGGQTSGQPMKLPDGTQVTNSMSLSKISQLGQAYQQYVAGGPQGLVYVDENRMSGLSAGAQVPIRQAANKAGIPVLNANDISGVQSLDVTFKSLDAMGKLADTALSSGLWGRIKGLTINALKQQFQTGEKVTDPVTGNQVPLGVLLGNFDQYRDSAIKAVTALAGGQGSGLRLNTGTIETAANNLPTSKDSLEYAKAKIATFQSLLTRQLSEKFPEIKPENQTGGNTGGSPGTGITNSKGQVTSASF